MMSVFWIFVLVVLVAFSAFFSASEIALFTLTRVRIRRMVKQGIPGANAIEKIKQNPRRLITTILIGNNVVNISASAIGTGLAISYFGEAGVGIATGIMTFIILTFGEIIPKTFAVQKAEDIARSCVPVLQLLESLFLPIIIGFEFVPKLLLKNTAMSRPMLTQTELRAILEIGVEEKAIEEAEHQLINKLLDFRGSLVKNSMLPLEDAVMLDSSMSVQAAKSFAIEKGFSRYPVYSKDVDRVMGIIHTKHLDRLIKEGKGALQLREILSTLGPIFVSENEPLNALFKKMQYEHIHMAVVVDEKWNQTGIIAFEDLLEEIFGDIKDEEERKRGKAEGKR
ncbi:MAG: hemolysin family protein [Candidatus Micrarchaeota archaeon]